MLLIHKTIATLPVVMFKTRFSDYLFTKLQL